MLFFIHIFESLNVIIFFFFFFTHPSINSFSSSLIRQFFVSLSVLVRHSSPLHLSSIHPSIHPSIRSSVRPSIHPAIDGTHDVQVGRMNCVPACGLATVVMCRVRNPACTARERPWVGGFYVNGRAIKKCLQIQFGFIRHSEDRLNTEIQILFHVATKSFIFVPLNDPDWVHFIRPWFKQDVHLIGRGRGSYSFKDILRTFIQHPPIVPAIIDCTRTWPESMHIYFHAPCTGIH